eukprot:TRINITY_DN1442_c0_g1_i1.p1 TRINITY_DN1442_c0_g1~~TRINITY_DN1442_c0_g1_i1.p1  ORF type:complete len:922 (-),score=128.35 TRINITY_DN1442_c0_g1_i1:373-3138(-)
MLLLFQFVLFLQIWAQPDLNEQYNIGLSPIQEETFEQAGQSCQVCEPNKNVFANQQEIKSDIFNSLLPELYTDIIEYLEKKLPIAVNKRRQDGSFQWPPPPPTEDQICIIEAYPVPKEEALEYLDRNGTRPHQYALVTIARGSRKVPDVVEFKVGPLPINENSTLVQLTVDGAIPWKKHPYFLNQLAYQTDLVNQVAYNLREIFKHATGGFCIPFYPFLGQGKPGEECGLENRFRWLEHPVLNSRGRRLGRIFFHFQPDVERHGDGMNLHPVPITFVIDSSDPNYTNWRISDFVYCDQGPFKTVQELLYRFRSGSIHRCQPALEWGASKDSPQIGALSDLAVNNSNNNNYNDNKNLTYDSRWSDLYSDSIYSLHGKSPSDGQPQPRSFMPKGARFRILGDSTTGRRVQWLDWEVHIVLKPRTAIALYDVKFKGERIAYEIALQEQYVAYGGYGGMGQLMYLDSYFMLGSSASMLKKGYDCPEHAVYLPVQKVTPMFSTFVQNDTICIFEADGQIPLWRHYQSFANEVFAGRNTYLVVRLVLTIENYDYMYSLALRQDGSIHVKIDMNGFVSTSFFDPQGGSWRSGNMGTRIHKYAFANLHDHLSSFKVDLDVKGQKNSFLRYIERSGTYSEAINQYSQFLDESPDESYLAQKVGFIQTIENEVENTLGFTPIQELSPFITGNNIDFLSSKEVDELDEKYSDVSPRWFENQQTKFMQMQIQKKELGMKLSYDRPSIFQFINEEHIDKWGNPKGIQIKFDSTVGQVLPDNHPYLKAAPWTKYHIAVTKRKEAEQYVMSTQYDWYLPDTPIVSLNDYLNGENIRQQDLVAWIMVGVQHLPRTEDVPVVSAISTGFHIEPRNYFDHMPGINGFEDLDINITCVPDIQAGETRATKAEVEQLEATILEAADPQPQIMSYEENLDLE